MEEEEGKGVVEVQEEEERIFGETESMTVGSMDKGTTMKDSWIGGHEE